MRFVMILTFCLIAVGCAANSEDKKAAEACFSAGEVYDVDTKANKVDFLEKCDGLSDEALKRVFRKQMSFIMQTDKVKFRNEKLTESDIAIDGKGYYAEVKTPGGYKPFLAYMSIENSLVVIFDYYPTH